MANDISSQLVNALTATNNRNDVTQKANQSSGYSPFLKGLGLTAGSIGGAGLGSYLGGGFSGKPQQINQLSQFTPQQQGLQNQSIQQILQLLGGAQAPFFEPIAQGARERFQTQTIPSLAERFTSLGGGHSTRNASGFQGQLGAAGAGLESQLAQLQAGSNLDLLRLLLSGAYATPNENIIQPEQKGFLQSGGELLLKVLPTLLGLI